MIRTKAYRAVVNILRNILLPFIIPCHRAMRKDGKIGGLRGVNENCWITIFKKELLQIEGYSV